MLSKYVRKTISMINALAIALSVMTTALAAQPVSDDLQGHWAEPQLREWVKQDLLQGYEGAYYPDRMVTRAEFIALINRSFHFSETTDIQFADLDTSHWAYNQIAVAIRSGYVSGYDDHTIRANQSISREEAAAMVYKLLGLEPSNKKNSLQFKDAGSISAWSQTFVEALADAKIIEGNSAGNFEPQGRMTRAEAVTVLTKAVAAAKPKDTIYSAAGVFGPTSGIETIKGNVIVSSPGVTLQNVIIEGNLTVTEAVGEGDANFKKVTVKGLTTIKGGGANSVHFDDSVLVRISIDKQTGTVRVVVAGDSTIQHVVVHSPVKLEESSVTNSGFANVEISEDLPAGSQVQLIGQFEDVSVKTSDIKVSIPSGSVKQLNVAEGALHTEIDVDTNATITDLVLKAVAKLLGQGTIEKATITNTAAGSSFQKRPATVAGDAANSITTNPVTSIPVSTNNGDNGSSNGNNNGNNNGGNSGGDNGGEVTPTPCTGTPDECRYAKLNGFSLTGYPLNQLDANQYTLGQTTFDADVLAYSVVIDRDMVEPESLNFSVTKNTYTSVRYYAFSTGYKIMGSGTVTENEQSIVLRINAKQDVILEISVNSGDGIATKVYRVYIQYPRTIQEGMRIGSYVGSTLINDQFTPSNKYYELQVGQINGEKIRRDDNILVYEENSLLPFLNCTSNCSIPEGKLAQTGAWRVEIKRSGTVLYSGEYQFDPEIAPVVSGDIGLEVTPYTKQELIDQFVQSHSAITPFQYGYKVLVDYGKISSVIPNAKYIAIKDESIIGIQTTLPQGLLADEYKLSILPIGFYNYMLTLPYSINNVPGKQQVTAILFSGADGIYKDNHKFVYDKFLHMGIYDVNFNLIGQYILPVHFDANHISDGSEAAGNWSPQP